MKLRHTIDYNSSFFPLRVVFVILYIMFYCLLLFLFFIDIRQNEIALSFFELIYTFVRYVILASGFIPLLVWISWTLCAKYFNEWFSGIFYMIFAIFLHFFVTMFNAHTNIIYYLLQLIEFVFLGFSLNSLYSFIKNRESLTIK